MKRLGDRHGGDFGADLPGKKHAVFNCLGGEFGPVGWDQDVLYKAFVLLSSALLTIGNRQTA